jgi:hypothetical protein
LKKTSRRGAEAQRRFLWVHAEVVEEAEKRLVGVAAVAAIRKVIGIQIETIILAKYLVLAAEEPAK